MTPQLPVNLRELGMHPLGHRYAPYLEPSPCRVGFALGTYTVG